MNLSETNFTNLTTYQDVHLQSYGNIEIKVSEVIADVCKQIDTGIIFSLFLILTFYIFSRIIIPYGLKGWEEVYPLFKGFFDFIKVKVYDVLETFSLIAILYIIGLKIYQGLPTRYYVWLGILGVLVGMCALSKYIRKFKEWRNKKK